MEVKAAWKAVCFLLILFSVTCSQTQGSVINLFDVLFVDIFILAGLKVKICCLFGLDLRLSFQTPTFSQEF